MDRNHHIICRPQTPLYNSFNIRDLRLAAPARLITRLLSTTYIIFLFWAIFLNKKNTFLKKEVALSQTYAILLHEQRSAYQNS